MQIKHRFIGNVLFDAEVASIKLCVEAAVKSGADLGGADLRSADLEGANLEGAYLGGANLGGAYLGRANLGRADLRIAYLGGAYLGRANLGRADLRIAYLGGAYLRSADLEGANLEGAYLGGADLEGAEGIIRIGPTVDGHEFFAVRHEKSVMIKAGCRWFTFKEANKHWKDDDRPAIGDQRRRWLKFIKAEAKALGWAV